MDNLKKDLLNRLEELRPFVEGAAEHYFTRFSKKERGMSPSGPERRSRCYLEIRKEEWSVRCNQACDIYLKVTGCDLYPFIKQPKMNRSDFDSE